MERSRYKTSDVARQHAKVYYEKHKDSFREERIIYGRKYRKQLKEVALEHYGKMCYCCGEATPLLLTIDHVNNDGADHRRSIGNGNKRAGYNFYLWLQRNNWPVGFQTACFNCNQGKFLNGGICPHQRATGYD